MYEEYFIAIIAILVVAMGVWIYTKTKGRNSTVKELSRLAKLKEQGVLTDEEFDEQKAKILNK